MKYIKYEKNIRHAEEENINAELALVLHHQKETIKFSENEKAERAAFEVKQRELQEKFI